MTDPEALDVRVLRSLLGEARQVIADLVAGVACAGAIRRRAALSEQYAASPLYDLEAERVLLGAALRRGGPVEPSLFSPKHYPIAYAIECGVLGDGLLDGEQIGYRRGLARRGASTEALRAAGERLLALRGRRWALEAIERAGAVLQSGHMTSHEVDMHAAAELRIALAALGAGDR